MSGFYCRRGPRPAPWCDKTLAARLARPTRYIGAGIAFSAIGSVGIGIGTLFAGLLQAMALNPVLVPRLFSYGLLGFALVESAILFALLGGLFVMFV